MFHEEFNAKKEMLLCIDRIKQWFDNESGGAKGVVVGISGGKDSAVVAKLMAVALGEDKVLGVLLPYKELTTDFEDSKNLCNLINIRSIILNITTMVDSAKSSLFPMLTESGFINIQPRIRMTMLYAIAQSLSYRVIGTGNSSEEYVGYCTKWGDNACDFNPLFYFTVDEVISIGHILGLPNNIIHKIPSDGLCGKSDEENLGFSYDDVDKCMFNLTDNISTVTYNKIALKHKASIHKQIDNIPNYKPGYIK